MSTQHDIEKEREAQTFPQPPQGPPRPQSRRWVVITAIAVMLVLVLSLGVLFIPGVIQRPGGQLTPAPTSPATQVTPTAPTKPTPGNDLTPTPAPGVVLGPQACPSGIANPAHWDAIIGTNNGQQHVESISCANIIDNPSLQALVMVRHTDASATLDVYVFQNVTSAKPTQIFKLPGLVKGNSMISGYNTVMTAEVDRNSTLNAGKTVPATTPDIFREFDWSASKGTLVQTAFPGIFPDLTRYQAEADQALVNKGQDTWKNDPQAVAKAMTVQFLSWKGTLTSTITSGGGAKDVYATVKVAHPTQGTTKPPSVNVTLSRLEGNTHNMWVAIGVEDGTGTLTSVTARSLVASPLKIEGRGDSFGGAIGEVYILDHLYTTVGQAHVSSSNGLGSGVSPYSLLVSYTTSFRQGPQEGIVELQLTSTMGPTAYSAVMVKVLLGPDALGNPAYWNQFLPAEPYTSIADRVTFGNLLGKPTLQAMVVAHEIVGGGPLFRSVFVFDNILADRPMLLFSVKHLLLGDAQISGYSTIMTAEVDLNSSINKGKTYALLTPDLYREFQWSAQAGTFVQVVFPGFYPDLTRWQAEVDQVAVSQGNVIWKLDAVKVTQHWNLIGGTAKLVKGGGSHDLTAIVNVTFPSPGSPTSIPVTQVTLNRLEGNPTGIWEITAVESNGLFIYTPKSGTTISSPVTVTGYGPQFESQVGTVYILDHLYQKIQVGDNFAMLLNGSLPPAKFSLDVPYKSSFQGGAQEGIVELVHTSGASFDIRTVMVKVLISA
jgi:hypothetical protein